MGTGHLPSDFRPQVGETGSGHFASIVLASDTFGHSLAFFRENLQAIANRASSPSKLLPTCTLPPRLVLEPLALRF